MRHAVLESPASKHGEKKITRAIYLYRFGVASETTLLSSVLFVRGALWFSFFHTSKATDAPQFFGK